jgi:trigger factor
VLPGVKTVDELHEKIRENLRTQQLSRIKSELTEKIVKQVVEISNVSIPPVLINAEIHALEENMANRLKQQKLSLDQYLQYTGKDHEAFHEELRPQATDRIKTVLVLRELATKEGVTVEQDEFNKEIEKMVAEFTKDVPEEDRDERGKAMRDYLTAEQTQSQLRDEIFSKKLTNRLLELATGVKQDDDEEAEFADVPENSARETEAEAVLAGEETVPDAVSADEVETPLDQAATSDAGVAIEAEASDTGTEETK